MNMRKSIDYMSREGLKKVNETLIESFGSDFGGVLLGAYITTIDKENSIYVLSMVFGTTTGGRNDFLIKQKLDLAEAIFEDIYQVERFHQTIVQVLKEGETYSHDQEYPEDKS